MATHSTSSRMLINLFITFLLLFQQCRVDPAVFEIEFAIVFTHIPQHTAGIAHRYHVGRQIMRDHTAGTHNGMRNIVYHLENDKFPRVKVGIGKPDKEHGEEMVDFVLSPMDSDTFAACKAVPDLIYDLLENGIDHAMQEFNKFVPAK
jgi:hypothetical protein